MIKVQMKKYKQIYKSKNRTLQESAEFLVSNIRYTKKVRQSCSFFDNFLTFV
jgi:hypothetical protein